ncbi:hypothetical protein L1987_74866 [Smallanthus sonchifolius]|uniref:Uncharacterized protein n=1 Tax=Smallanthus sonchifolius TaxID=185202 RepID=A0ACB9A4W1_9ASTR|nr:hypothetical protein L1987_74866 [Smallanthus sonchifolius]
MKLTTQKSKFSQKNMLRLTRFDLDETVQGPVLERRLTNTNKSAYVTPKVNPYQSFLSATPGTAEVEFMIPIQRQERGLYSSA